jgi:hypothetical protein
MSRRENVTYSGAISRCQDRQIMQNRRQAVRTRTYLGGTIGFTQHASTLLCIVRNMTPAGAKIELQQRAKLPGEIDLAIPHRGEHRRARIVWHHDGDAGIAFVPTSPSADDAPPDAIARLKKLQSKNRKLRQELRRLRDGTEI